ncbi:MAG TPA: tRNA-dihydrouridine synthase family protein [Phycisphaerae bacterium]|nr:tRNA-dihydrouridine synthase family protein [Phycisphaerae bacterium]
MSALKPFCLGGLEIGSPVVLAPLAGYSDLAYRLICRRLGAGYCATEMMLDRMVLVPGKLRRRLVQIGDEDHPVAGQIVGNDPGTMAAAARVLCEMGFDVIDLNFACPVRKALARRRGGFLMSQPDVAVAITRAVVAACDRPVTLKLRQKFRRADDNDAFWRIAEGAFDAGAAAVCLHARSVEQKYLGPADWAFLAEAKRHFHDRTIIGSGDILKPADALAMLEQTGVEAVTVARGCLGNPWFFRQAGDVAAGREPYRPTLAEQREVLLGHFAHACELYGERRGANHMRKFGIKYARLHPRSKDIRLAFTEVKTARQWHAVLQEHYAEGQAEGPALAE